jgi:sulfide:quinone oxidoreductase
MGDGAASSSGRSSILIAGGGVAGLEALLALSDLAGDRAALTLLAPDPDFTYMPLMVEEPFLLGIGEKHALGPLAEELGARFIQQAVVGVRLDDHAVDLADGSSLGYATLIVCVGGRFRPAYRDAVTFPSPGEPLQIDELLDQIGGDGSGRIAFVVPPGVSWPLPIYELALMTQRRALSAGRDDVTVSVVTPESAPLIMFGRPASEAVATLLRGRGIELQTDARAHELDEGGLVLTPGDRRLDADRVVALPLIEGPHFPGLPIDEGGFIPIDEHARVRDAEDVYAAGDGTTFPIKQGGIGTQQADAAAEHIAARLGASVEPQPFRPVLRGKLLAGDESLSLSHHVAGGGGEGTASLDYLWWPPHKISGRYLAPWLAHGTVHREPEPPSRPLDVEVALPEEWHEQPSALDPYGPLNVD